MFAFSHDPLKARRVSTHFIHATPDSCATENSKNRKEVERMVSSCWQEDVFCQIWGRSFPLFFSAASVSKGITVAASYFLSVFSWLKKLRLQRKT